MSEEEQNKDRGAAWRSNIPQHSEGEKKGEKPHDPCETFLILVNFSKGKLCSPLAPTKPGCQGDCRGTPLETALLGKLTRFITSARNLKPAWQVD